MSDDAVTDLAIARAVLGAIPPPTFPAYLAGLLIRGDDPLQPSLVPWRPWPHLVERAEAWAGGASEVVLKARQLGFTWLLAACLSWRARYHGWACGVWSRGQDEARDVLRRVTVLEGGRGGTPTADRIAYPGGGWIDAHASTPSAGVGYTYQLAVMDELAFHAHGADNYAALRPTLAAGGQFLATTTANPLLGSSGVAYDLYWASARGETPYGAVFVPWSARPDRDAVWLEHERAAFTGHAEEFDAFYPETPAAAFVGRSGLVFSQFRTERHVRPAPCKWEECKWRVAGVDWGGGDPTAVIPLGITGRQQIHQYGELYQRGPVTIEEISRYLIDLHRRAPLSFVVCDPSQAVSIASLAAVCRPHFPVGPGRADPAGRNGWTATLLDNDRLTIGAECVWSVAEFAGYRWRNRTDPNDRTRYATSTGVDNHADAMDARGYALLAVLAELLGAASGSVPIEHGRAGDGDKTAFRRKVEAIQRRNLGRKR